MIHRMFAIFDAKALAYLPPFVLPEVGMALRTFGDCVNSDDHQFGAHPEDYTLFNIGSYDDKTGLISGLDTRCVVANGVEVVRSVEDPDQVSLPLNGGDSEGSSVSVTDPGNVAGSIAELREAFKVPEGE